MTIKNFWSLSLDELNQANIELGVDVHSSIIKNLYVSISDSHAPLIAGFFLDGPIIADRKKWNFGDNEVEKNNNLLCTHTYWEPGDYTMWVDLIDKNDKVIESSKEIPIHVRDKTKTFTFDQWQGIIYEGDNVGFSLSTSLPGTPKIIWEWGDGKVNSSDDPDFFSRRLNPHYKYNEVKTFTGAITVSENKIPESRKFAVMVLPSKIKNIGGYIEVASASRRDGNEELPANKKLTLQAQVTGGIPEYSCVWKFGDKSGGGGKMTEHVYTKAGNYNASCTVRDSVGLTLSLSKTVVIR